MKLGWKRKKQIMGEDLKEILEKSEDFQAVSYQNKKTKTRFTLFYITSLVDERILHEIALPKLLNGDFKKLGDAKKILPLAEVDISRNKNEIEQKLFNGAVLLTVEGEKGVCCFFSAQKENVRNISLPEIEFSVLGPKETFVESLKQNLNLIRKRIPVKELIVEEIIVGRYSKTRVAILYIEGLTNEENVNTVRQRVEGIEYDEITDSSYVMQLISDNTNSPFPQMLDTERPDRVAAALTEGKVVLLVDGSPHAVIAPTTLVEFFNSYEDYLLDWILASFIRFIRFFAIAFSVLATPAYVAILSYHYQLIPVDLLNTLVASRRMIPFPPVLEAFFLEITIELLREAGARLPTKVGQTIGIVGGIVIGTASVEAGLTSNVLLIIVALSALASFTTPVHRIGNTIRLLRFPFLIFAELWGLLGIVVCLCFVTTHLLRLTSLGRPYLEPIYPPRLHDLKEAFVRPPLSTLRERPQYLRTKKPARFSRKAAKEKKDIDE